MNCGHSRKLLAWYVGGDLPADKGDDLRLHLEHCRECRECYLRLDGNQNLLRSLRQEVVTAAALAEMRRSLFSRIEDARGNLGWRVRFERVLFGELRRPRYAVLCFALLAIISATVFAQLRHVSASPDSAIATLEESDTLRLSESFREWVLIGTSTQFSHSGKGRVPQNVYMHPEAYRSYQKTRRFPEGTVLVLEAPGAGGNDRDAGVLVASVKNDRRPGGWAYFQFENGGEQKTDDPKTNAAQPLPETAGCLACHRERGATDHVFTQFYPVLRSASGVL